MRIPAYGRSARRPPFGAYLRSRGVRASDIARADWRKSSWSAYNGDCVEFAPLEGNRVGVRDTKDSGQGPILVFNRSEWEAFVLGAKNGEFDLP